MVTRRDGTGIHYRPRDAAAGRDAHTRLTARRVTPAVPKANIARRVMRKFLRTAYATRPWYMLPYNRAGDPVGRSEL